MNDAVAIVGLGAIGGSIALELLSQGEHVIAYDVDPRALDWAEFHDIPAFRWGGVVSARRVIIAVPVHETGDVMRSLSGSTDFLFITDVCSTKRKILGEARQFGLAECFVGAHPLAGTHQSGASAARLNMFRGRTVFVCPAPQASADAVEAVNALWRRMGTQIVEIEASTHDQELAWLSHLPQLTSNALALALKSGGFKHASLGPGGQDMTRLAASDAELWEGILNANADMLDEPLSCMINALEEIRDELRRGDSTRLLNVLRTSNLWCARN